MTVGAAGDLTLHDPRIQELDRAASRVCVELCEAIETATRAGVPAEIIAKYTNKPLPEVQLIIEEMCDIEEAARLPPPPVAPDRSPAQGVGPAGAIPVNRVIPADQAVIRTARMASVHLR